MQLDFLQEVGAAGELADEDGEVGVGRRAEFRDFFGTRLADELRVRRALALEDRAIRERAEQRVEDAVGRVPAADVMRDEAEERERVADRLLERRRVRAGDGASQPCADRFERGRLRLTDGLPTGPLAIKLRL